MEPRVVMTEDGSTSLFVASLDEQYHSIHGAIQESMHVFIRAGLQEKLQQQADISILEMGFGTGLNTLLTLVEAGKFPYKINYTAIEKYPLPEAIYTQLNYGTLIQVPDANGLFMQLHKAEWNNEIRIQQDFYLKKIDKDLADCIFDEKFDLIYYDAFAPSVQPELWTKDIFDKLYNALHKNGILVTYCAKGSVKRTLKEAGFTIEPLPGPIGKREMTRARK